MKEYPAPPIANRALVEVLWEKIHRLEQRVIDLETAKLPGGIA